MTRRTLLRTTVYGVLLTGCLLARPASAQAAAEVEVRRVLEQWPRDFNARNVSATCGLFAPDLVASYPDQPDKGYDAMCKHLTAALHDPARTFRYGAPQIEAILVSGDLAVVRLIWTLHITSPKVPTGLTIKENGVDVLRRQKDGSWRISISHAYPLSSGAKSGRAKSEARK